MVLSDEHKEKKQYKDLIDLHPKFSNATFKERKVIRKENTSLDYKIKRDRIECETNGPHPVISTF